MLRVKFCNMEALIQNIWSPGEINPTTGKEPINVHQFYGHTWQCAVLCLHQTVKPPPPRYHLELAHCWFRSLQSLTLASCATTEHNSVRWASLAARVLGPLEVPTWRWVREPTLGTHNWVRYPNHSAASWPYMACLSLPLLKNEPFRAK